MMKKALEFFKHKAYEFRWAFLSGILVGTTYIPFPPWALMFCYVPLWLSLASDDLKPGKNLSGSMVYTLIKKYFWAGWVTQFTLTLIGFHWIAYTAHHFGNLPWIVSVAALLLFCAFMHLYVPAALSFAAWLRWRFSLTPAQALFSVALVHSLLERVWPVIFDWHLGYSLLWAQIPIYHLADVVGFLGLSSWILLLNAWVAVIWLQRKAPKRTFSSVGALFSGLIILVALGSWQGKKWNHFDGEVKATVIQANIGNLEKVAAEKGRGYQESITNKFIAMTQDAHLKFPDTDIFIWPETAFPDYLDQHLLQKKRTLLLAAGLTTIGKPLITGAYSIDPHSDKKKDKSTYNALFLVDSAANSLAKPYRKTELLAFGEYLPLSERFPFILKLLPFVSNFGRGQGPDVLTWNRDSEVIRWGAQICYEGLYPNFSRGLEKKGADILVNVTNDSWFGKTFEPHQHGYMTLARAIEVRRPLIRSTNTGISTAILANGEILQKSPIHQEWSGQFVLKYLKNAPSTFYVRAGYLDWTLLLSALVLIIFIGAYRARTRRP